jgi:hypothetical protein
MDFILVARLKQRLAGLKQLGNREVIWIGVTRFVA